MKRLLWACLIVAVLVGVGFGCRKIWEANQPPHHVVGRFVGKSILKVGQDSYLIDIFDGELGLYFMQKSKGKRFEGYQYWVLEHIGCMGYGSIDRSYVSKENLVFVGPFNFIDPAKRGFKDMGGPTLEDGTLHFQVDDGVFGDMKLRGEMVGKAKVYIQRGKEEDW